MAVLSPFQVALVTLLLTSGCAAQAVNSALVYQPVVGTITMEITIPPGESVAKVQFQVNDKVVGEDADPTDGYKADIDTSSLEMDVLAKIAAVGVRANGTTVVLRENFILVGDNNPVPATTTADPEASAPVTTEPGVDTEDGAVGGETT